MLPYIINMIFGMLTKVKHFCNLRRYNSKNFSKIFKHPLYVFSATGNSLTTAKILAEKMNAKLISVASTRNLKEIIEEKNEEE